MKDSQESQTSQMLVKSIMENQRAEVRLVDFFQLHEMGGKPGQGYPAILIYYAEDSPAKICQSQEGEKDLQELDQDCSLSLPESQMNQSETEDSYLLKMYRASSHRIKVKTSESSSKRFSNAGLMICPGELLIANISECPKDGDESSSLVDVLEEQVADKYFLSQKAATGILKRSEKRGRKIPSLLLRALEAVAQTTMTPKMED